MFVPILQQGKHIQKFKTSGITKAASRRIMLSSNFVHCFDTLNEKENFSKNVDFGNHRHNTTRSKKLALIFLAIKENIIKQLKENRGVKYHLFQTN